MRWTFVVKIFLTFNFALFGDVALASMTDFLHEERGGKELYRADSTRLMLHHLVNLLSEVQVLGDILGASRMLVLILLLSWYLPWRILHCRS